MSERLAPTNTSSTETSFIWFREQPDHILPKSFSVFERPAAPARGCDVTEQTRVLIKVSDASEVETGPVAPSGERGRELTVAVEQLQPVVDPVVGLLSVVLLVHKHKHTN